MPYTKITTNSVKAIIVQYKNAADDLPNKTNDTERAKVTATMQSLGAKAEENLNANIRIAAGYFAQHHAKAEKWQKDAQTALKDAKDAAAKYKKKPASTEFSAQVQGRIDQITRYQQEYTQDNLDLGNAWGEFRQLARGDLPQKYFQHFSDERAKLVNSQQSIVLLNNQMTAAFKEAKALKAIVSKTNRQVDIKGGAQKRDVAVAQQKAVKVATELAAALVDLRGPANITNRPASIATAATQLNQIAKGVNFNQKSDLGQAHGMWIAVDAAYKTAVTKVKSMETVLATRTKGFHSSELSDAAVKLQLANGARSVKDAQTDLKTWAKDYANAKKANAAVEAKFKKLGIR